MQEMWTEFIFWYSPLKSVIIALLGFLLSFPLWLGLVWLFPRIKKTKNGDYWPPARYAVLIFCLFGVFMTLKTPPHIALLDQVGRQYEVLNTLYTHHPELKPQVTHRINTIVGQGLSEQEAVHAVTVALIDEITPLFLRYVIEASPEAVHSFIGQKVEILSALNARGYPSLCAEYISGKTDRIGRIAELIGTPAVRRETAVMIGIIESALKNPDDPPHFTVGELEERLEQLYRNSGEDVERIAAAMQAAYMTDRDMCRISIILHEQLLQLPVKEASDIYKNILLLSP
ncbi:MAG: hypothetical protein EA357_11340 [Micavibrio sp.]|nr:MAG: hypothetical protein EA357_11340 [Micavibrio sp.]